jgi:hypothetical protein
MNELEPARSQWLWFGAGLPKRISEVLHDGAALLKEAKGLGR